MESIGAAEITLLPPLAIAHAVVRSTGTMEISRGATFPRVGDIYDLYEYA